MKAIQFNINMSNKWLYTFIALGLLVLAGVFVYAGDMIFESGDLNVSDVLYVDSTNNLVGIGTTSPTSKLDVSHSTSVSDETITAKIISTGGGIIKGINLDVDSSGTPGQKSIYGTDLALDSSDTASTYSGVYMYGHKVDLTSIGVSPTQSSHYLYGFYSNLNGNIGTTSDTRKYGAYLTASGTADRNYGLYTSVSGATTDWGIYTTGEDKNYFSGKVGIGTSSPTMKLDVNGNVTADDFITKSLFYNGDALGVIKNIKSEDTKDNWGGIDHSTLGGAEVIFNYEVLDENNKTVVKTFEGQSVDKTIALLLKANQQLMEELCKKDNSYSWC